MRVLAAMSGGVDSAVAAARAARAGHDVTGRTLALPRNPDLRTGARGCTLEDSGSPAGGRRDRHSVLRWDRPTGSTRTGGRFVAEYAAGVRRTPVAGNEKSSCGVLDGGSPGLRCRRHRPHADSARTGCCDVASTWPRTSRTCWPADASSWTGRCSRSQLDEGEVRAEAASVAWRSPDKRNSHDICFIRRRRHARFSPAARRGARRSVVDASTARSSAATPARTRTRWVSDVGCT